LIFVALAGSKSSGMARILQRGTTGLQKGNGAEKRVLFYNFKPPFIVHFYLFFSHCRLYSLQSSEIKLKERVYVLGMYKTVFWKIYIRGNGKYLKERVKIYTSIQTKKKGFF